MSFIPLYRIFSGPASKRKVTPPRSSERQDFLARGKAQENCDTEAQRSQRKRHCFHSFTCASVVHHKAFGRSQCFWGRVFVVSWLFELFSLYLCVSVSPLPGEYSMVRSRHKKLSLTKAW